MKKIVFGLMVAALQIGTAFSAYAGQRITAQERWTYEDNQGMAKNQWEEENGAWMEYLGQEGDQAISPWFYQSILGKGMDVTWSEFPKRMSAYNEQMVKDFKEAGVSHVRIRVKDDITPEQLERLDRQITDCLKNGVIPILAYQAHEFKENPNEETMNHVVQWWKTMAEHYQNYSHLLSFDLMIESSDAVNKMPEVLNQLYERTVSAIRETNPDRIIIISPRLRSDPYYLHELKIPTDHNGYLMAEWHFYASGPDKINEKKKWTIGTEEEKKLITDKIEAALTWQEQTGIPTWVGAWMPGNYNKGNTYSVEEQTVFSAYMTSALTSAGIPFAVNADTKYYVAETNTWIQSMLPIVNTIWGG